ncbi:SHOCT domain-containing protein (plasmid) [Citricoccus nitrophenolicus]
MSEQSRGGKAKKAVITLAIGALLLLAGFISGNIERNPYLYECGSPFDPSWSTTAPRSLGGIGICVETIKQAEMLTWGLFIVGGIVVIAGVAMLINSTISAAANRERTGPANVNLSYSRTPSNTGVPSVSSRLQQLQELFDAGAISEAEYTKKRASLLELL